MSQAGIIDVISNNPEIPTQFDADTSFAIPIANILEIKGVAAQGVSTSGNGLNRITVTVADSTTASKGVAQFDSTDFTVTAGVVTLNATGAGQTITGDSGGALNPTLGNWNILGASVASGTTPVATAGSVSTLTINVQRAQALAAADSTKVGLANFDSTNFAVSANGFVTFVNGSGFVTSVSGTTDRITATAGTTPVIDISGNYVGQSSITTLGTITTGIWNGTTIAVNKGGTGAVTLTGVLTGNGTGAVTASTVTQYGVLIGSASNAVGSTAVGTANQVLMSGGAGVNPSYSTATYISAVQTAGRIMRSNGTTGWTVTTSTYPSTNAVSTLLYASATDTMNALATANNGLLVTSSSGVPSILAGPGATGRVLMSNAAAAPSFSTATYQSTAGTSGNVLTSDGTNWISSAPIARTLTGNSGGAISPSSGNWNILTVPANAGLSFTITGSGSTLTLNTVDALDNVFLGRVSGKVGVTGNQNVGIGTGTLQNITSGVDNVGIGFASANGITTGSYNTGVGRNALATLSTTNGSTGIGYQCLNGCTGTGNTAVGYQAYINLPSGSSNLGLGYGVGSAYTGSESSNINIQSAGVLGESNALRIGTSGSGNLQVNKCFIAGITGVTIAGGATTLCDGSGQLGTIVSAARYKENIEDINEKTSILELTPVEFNYKADETKTKIYGFIAEEVEKECPDLCIYNKEGQVESVKYHEMPALLLKEIQRLTKRVESLEGRI